MLIDEIKKLNCVVIFFNKIKFLKFLTYRNFDIKNFVISYAINFIGRIISFCYISSSLIIIQEMNVLKRKEKKLRHHFISSLILIH